MTIVRYTTGKNSTRQAMNWKAPGGGESLSRIALNDR